MYVWNTSSIWRLRTELLYTSFKNTLCMNIFLWKNIVVELYAGYIFPSKNDWVSSFSYTTSPKLDIDLKKSSVSEECVVIPHFGFNNNFLFYYYFVRMGVLPTCMTGACGGRAERVLVLWNWSCRQWWATMWVLGIEPGSSEREASALITSPFSSPWTRLFQGQRYRICCPWLDICLSSLVTFC